MLINYLFLILCLFSSCSFPDSSRQEMVEDRFGKERDRAIYSALKKFIKDMEVKGYRAAGIGEGIDHSTRKQNYLGVTFDIESLPDVDFARRVEVETLQALQKHINEEEGIKDYVAEYPYPVKFMRIAFISRNPHQGLCSVANCLEEIYYDQNDPDKPIGPSIEIHSESYEEAVRILEQ